MKTKRDILDPTIDQDELIIDSETVTQWVDRTLSVPHEASVDSLASKFACLRHYGEDAAEIRTLIQASYKANIKAPADTAARVLKSIKSELPSVKETSSPVLSESITTTLDAGENQPVQSSPPTTTVHEPFVLNFPEEEKKRHSYLWPIAALLFLMAFVGSIVHSEYEKDAQLAKEEDSQSSSQNSKIKKTRKALIMSSDADQHTQRNNEAHMASYTLNTPGDIDDEKDKDEKEDKNETQDKKDPPSSEVK